MKKEKFFSNKELSKNNFGPESIFTTIYIKSRKKQLKMRSWHEYYEQNAESVVNEGGVHTDKDHGRLKMLKESSKEFLFYRLMWNEIRLKTSHLIPSESKPMKGKIVMKAGIVSWSESAVKNAPSKQRKSLKKK